MTRGAARSQTNPLALAGFAFFAALAALIIVIALTGNASDGEPSVSLALSSRPFPRQVVAASEALQPRLVNGNLAADPALIEKTAAGPLPIIAADGRKAMAAYARPFAAGGRPRIAVVIGGLGLSAGATRLALTHLPPAVTVSFAPYASGLQPWVDAARGQGREVLIEVPMEPLDYPANDPGPNTLLGRSGKNENTKRLYWALSRATGYVGITNLLGGRFLGDANAVEPVLAETAKRGLLFFDNGSHSATSAAAERTATPIVAGSLIIDAMQSRESIEAKLAELELRARETGTAVGSGILYPITIQKIAEWAKTLERRGFVLAPITAVIAPPETSPAPATAQ